MATNASTSCRLRGDDFLSDLCQQWEAATAAAEKASIRTVHLRTGIVLSAKGGALKKQLPLFKLGLGGRFGNGHQWQSWISIDDEVAAIVHLLSSEICGAVNLTAPNPVTNIEFTSTLAKVLHRPACPAGAVVRAEAAVRKRTGRVTAARRTASAAHRAAAQRLRVPAPDARCCPRRRVARFVTANSYVPVLLVGGVDGRPAGQFGIEVEPFGATARSASSPSGTAHITSNSMPSGSAAYRLLLTPWSLSPTSEPAATNLVRSAASSSIVLTCQARWYRPGECAAGLRPVSDGEQAEVMVVGGAIGTQEHGLTCPWSATTSKPSTVRVELGGRVARRAPTAPRG